MHWWVDEFWVWIGWTENERQLIRVWVSSTMVKNHRSDLFINRCFFKQRFFRAEALALALLGVPESCQPVPGTPSPLSYAPPHQVKVPVSRMVALLDRQEAAARVAPRLRAPPLRPATKVGVAEAAVATRAFLKAKGPPYLAGRGGVLASAAIYIPQF